MPKPRPIPAEAIEYTRKNILPNIVPDSPVCLEWTGKRNIGGYGMASAAGWRNRPYVVSRLVATALWGEPGGLFVLHRCDNPPCYNPSHLFLGTHTDNARDAKSKGRLAPQKPGYVCPIRGAMVSLAKLDDTRVAEMLNDLAGGMGPRAASRKFGVSISAVVRIKLGRVWKHIPRPGPMPRLPTPGQPGWTSSRISKVHEDEARTIISNLANGSTLKREAARTGFCISHICNVKKGRLWPNLPRPDWMTKDSRYAPIRHVKLAIPVPA